MDDLEEMEEVLNRARDPVEGSAEDRVDATGADVGKEALELGAAEGVLPGNGSEFVDLHLPPLLPAGGYLVLNVLAKPLKLVLEGAFLGHRLAEGYDGWTETDMVAGKDDEQVVTDRAWNRLLAEKKRELARLVEEAPWPASARGAAS